ncbi:MAG: signal peptidase II [Bacilli bacterium]|nr:signal peptidase II [Bacilli bacterium]
MKHKKIYLTTIITLLIDIISKVIITNTLTLKESIKIINKFFYITYTKNTGVAFSLLEGSKIFIIIATIIILIVLIKYLNNKYVNRLEQISYGLIIGGALGNLIDRIIYGYVIDFLDFKIFNYNYPIFNLADSAIVIGVIILIITSFKRK